MLKHVSLNCGMTILLLLTSTAAHAQAPLHVDPYQQRYGLAPPAAPPIEPRLLALPSGARAIVRTHIEALTAPLQRRLSTLPQVDGGGPLQIMADALRQEMAEVRDMESRGRYLAALQKAQLLGFTSDFIKTMIVALLRAQLGAERRGQVQPPRELPAPRARIAEVQARLDAMEPTSISTALALVTARSAVGDCTSLVDAFESHAPALWEPLERLLGEAAPEKRAAIVPFLAAALVSSMVDIALDDINVTIELAASDAPELSAPVRADADALSRLAVAYQRAAAMNVQALATRIEAMNLPPRDGMNDLSAALQMLLIGGHFKYLENQDDSGNAFVRFSSAFAAYVDSLSMAASLDVRAAEVSPPGEAKAAQAARVQATLNRLLASEKLDVRRSAASARKVLGGVPVAVIYNFQEGVQLSTGDADDRELALASLITADALAQVAVALGSPAPSDPNVGEPQAGAAPLDPGEEVNNCIGLLVAPDVGVTTIAKKWASKNHPKIDEDDREDLIAEAVLRVCVRAKDRRSDMKPLFWRVLKNLVADYYDAELVQERNAPRLMDACDAPGADEAMEARERQDLLHAALCHLPEADQEVLRTWSVSDQYSDVARELGISEEAARKRVVRALARLRKEVEQRGGLGWLWPPLLLEHLDWIALDRRPHASAPSATAAPSPSFLSLL